MPCGMPADDGLVMLSVTLPGLAVSLEVLKRSWPPGSALSLMTWPPVLGAGVVVALAFDVVEELPPPQPATARAIATGATARRERRLDMTPRWRRGGTD